MTSSKQRASAADEWTTNGSRRRYCSKIILAKQADGSPPPCWLCGQPGADSVDHVLPRSKYPGLTWELSNMKPAHKVCNSSKGDKGVTREIGLRTRRW